MRQLACLQTTLPSQILINLSHAFTGKLIMIWIIYKNWPLANQVSLNVLKTEYKYFAADYNLSNLGIFAIDPLKTNKQTITRVQSTKSLGVVFDQRLVWEEHVDSVCKRVLSGLVLAALKQARQDIPKTRF